jgi:hypothetical protein
MEVKLIEMKICDTEIPKEFHEFDVITDVESKLSFLRRDCFDRLIKKFFDEKQLLWIESPIMPDFDGEYLCIISKLNDCGTIKLFQKVISCQNNKWVGIDVGKETLTHFTKLVYPKND